MEKQLREIIEKTQIGTLLTRYFAAIDDKQLDRNIVELTFTSDAKIMRPNGSATIGHEQIFDGHGKSFARFRATHHVITDFLIDLDSQNGILRANLTAMHLWGDNKENTSLNNKHFLAGGVLLAKAVKADNNWRICELTNRNVWRTGEGMDEMAKYERPKN